MNPTQTNVPDTIFVDVDDTILDWTGEMMFRLTGARDFSHVTTQYDSKFFGGSELAKATVMENIGFWRSLELTNLGRALISAIKGGEFDQAVILVTATPPLMPGISDSVNAQVQRVASQAKRELGQKFGLPVCVITSHNSYDKWAKAKATLAGPRKLLIDDSESMVQAFTERGGQAVLVPKPWNDAPGDELDALEMLRFLCTPIEGLDF